MRHTCRHARAGVTLVELAIVVAIVGTLTGLVLLPARRLVDRIQARSAAEAFIGLCALAREVAIAQAATTTLSLDTAAASIAITVGRDTIRQDRLGDRFGVTFVATGTSVVYAANGTGYGRSNLTFIARRGAAAESVTVSRLGRVRH